MNFDIEDNLPKSEECHIERHQRPEENLACAIADKLDPLIEEYKQKLYTVTEWQRLIAEVYTAIQETIISGIHWPLDYVCDKLYDDPGVNSTNRVALFRICTPHATPFYLSVCGFQDGEGAKIRFAFTLLV